MYPYHPQGYPPGPPPPRWGPPQGAPPPAWHLHPPGMAVPPPNVPPPPGTALPPPVYAPPPTSYYGSYPPPPDPAVSAPTPAAVLTPVPAAVPADVPCNPPYPTVTVPQQQEQQMDTIRKANGEVPSFDEYLDFKKLLSRKEWKHLFGRDPTFKEYIEFYDRKEAINWMAVCGTVPTFEDYMEFLVERDSRDWVAFCQVIPTFKDFIDHIQKNASFDFKAECGLKPRFKDFMMYYKVIKKSKDWASLYKRQVTYVDFLSFTKQAQDKEWHDISPLRGSPKFEDFLDYTLECESRNWEKEYGSAPTFTEFVQVRELNEPGNLERFQGLEPRLEHLMEFKEHKKSRDWHEFCERLPSLEDFLAYLSHQSSPHWMTLADKYNDKPFFTDYMKFLQIRASKDWQALRGADPTFANFIEYLCRRQARDWKAVLGHVPSFHDFIEYVDHSASDEWKALGDAMPSFLAFMGYKLGVRIKDATTAREERFELDSWDKRVYRSRSRSRSRKRTFSRSTSPYGKRPRHRSRERSNDRHGDRARHRRSRSRSREGRNRYRRSRSRGYSPYRSGSRRHSNERSGRHHSGSRRSRSRSRGGRRSPAEAYDPFAPSLSSPPRGGGGRRRSEHMYDDISNSSFPDDSARHAGSYHATSHSDVTRGYGSGKDMIPPFWSPHDSPQSSAWPQRQSAPTNVQFVLPGLEPGYVLSPASEMESSVVASSLQGQNRVVYGNTKTHEPTDTCSAPGTEVFNSTQDSVTSLKQRAMRDSARQTIISEDSLPDNAPSAERPPHAAEPTSDQLTIADSDVPDIAVGMSGGDITAGPSKNSHEKVYGFICLRCGDSKNTMFHEVEAAMEHSRVYHVGFPLSIRRVEITSITDLTTPQRDATGNDRRVTSEQELAEAMEASPVYKLLGRMRHLDKNHIQMLVKLPLAEQEKARMERKKAMQEAVTCPTCRKDYHSSAGMMKHAATAHNLRLHVHVLRCFQCGFDFDPSGINRLYFHLRRHNIKITFFSELAKHHAFLVTVTPYERISTCSTCSFAAVSRDIMARHSCREVQQLGSDG